MESNRRLMTPSDRSTLVEGSVKMLAPVQELRLPVGHKGTIRISTTAAAKSFGWMKDGHIIPALPRFEMDATESNDRCHYSLTVRRMQREDAGIYSVVINGSALPVWRVIVEDLPEKQSAANESSVQQQQPLEERPESSATSAISDDVASGDDISDETRFMEFREPTAVEPAAANAISDTSSEVALPAAEGEHIEHTSTTPGPAIASAAAGPRELLDRFKAMEKADRERYAAEMAQYTAAGGSKKVGAKQPEGLKRPKRASFALHFFLAERRIEILKQNPTWTIPQIAHEAALQWKALLLDAETDVPVKNLPAVVPDQPAESSSARNFSGPQSQDTSSLSRKRASPISDDQATSATSKRLRRSVDATADSVQPKAALASKRSATSLPISPRATRSRGPAQSDSLLGASKKRSLSPPQDRVQCSKRLRGTFELSSSPSPAPSETSAIIDDFIDGAYTISPSLLRRSARISQQRANSSAKCQEAVAPVQSLPLPRNSKHLPILRCHDATSPVIALPTGKPQRLISDESRDHHQSLYHEMQDPPLQCSFHDSETRACDRTFVKAISRCIHQGRSHSIEIKQMRDAAYEQSRPACSYQLRSRMNGQQLYGQTSMD